MPWRRRSPRLRCRFRHFNVYDETGALWLFLRKSGHTLAPEKRDPVSAIQPSPRPRQSLRSARRPRAVRRAPCAAVRRATLSDVLTGALSRLHIPTHKLSLSRVLVLDDPSERPSMGRPDVQNFTLISQVARAVDDVCAGCDASAAGEMAWRRVDEARGGVQLGLGRRELLARQEVPWSFRSSARLYAGHAVAELLLAEILVEATGIAARNVERVHDRDAEGLPRKQIKLAQIREVLNLKYTLLLHSGSGDVDEVPLLVHNPGAPAPVYDCCMFSAAVVPSEREWEWRWDVRTGEGFEPSVALLGAFVVSTVLSPQKITEKLPVVWPDWRRRPLPESDSDRFRPSV
eukprot:SM000096S24892  [mRNA]  locus=s96:418471:420193:+ [translate_table: standard]